LKPTAGNAVLRGGYQTCFPKPYMDQIGRPTGSPGRSGGPNNTSRRPRSGKEKTRKKRHYKIKLLWANGTRQDICKNQKKGLGQDLPSGPKNRQRERNVICPTATRTKKTAITGSRWRMCKNHGSRETRPNRESWGKVGEGYGFMQRRTRQRRPSHHNHTREEGDFRAGKKSKPEYL